VWLQSIWVSRRINGCVFASLCLAVLFLPPAAAQPAAQNVAPDTPCTQAEDGTRIAVGQCRRSSIGPEDPTDASGTPYEEWQLTLQADQYIQIDLDASAQAPAQATAPAAGQSQAAPAAEQSQAPDAPLGDVVFDAALQLRRSGSEDLVASNDDSQGTLNSRIRYQAPEAGEYVVRAGPLYRGEGPYTLRVVAVPPPPPRTELPLGRAEFPIGPTSEESDTWFGYRVHRFTFTAEVGERIRITARSTMPSMIMELKSRLGNNIGMALAGSVGDSAEMIAVVPQSGIYFLDVNLSPVEGPGNFTLEFERRQAAPTRPPTYIAVGADISRTLGIDSNVTSEFIGGGNRVQLSELYALRVYPGETISVLLESTAFDPVLDAGMLTPLGFGAVLTNDDNDGTANSRLVLNPNRAGTVHLRVRALGNGTGPFRLNILRGNVTPAERPAQAQPARPRPAQ
jgi:hypothetical protein